MGSHHFLVDALHGGPARRPRAVRGGAEDRRRLEAANRVWIVDPLDGTREFGELGRPDWAVHVALVIDRRLAVGAVALPAMGVTYSTRGSPPVVPGDVGVRPGSW